MGRCGAVDSAPRRLFHFGTMVTINFYNYDGHPNAINKQLGDPTAIDGNLRQDFDVLHPVLILKKSPLPDYNYCYISALGRYYFVDRVTYVGNNQYEITLRVDVLKTYETQILAATATATRRADADKHISSRADVYDRQPHFEKIEFPNSGLLDENGTIIMVTIKGD